MKNISKKQRADFERYGLLRIENLLPENLVKAAQDKYFEYFAQKSIFTNGKWELEDFPIAAPINTSARLAKDLKHQSEFSEVFTSTVKCLVKNLLSSEKYSSMTKFPQLLFTLPNAEKWQVPLGPWHVDLPRYPEATIAGVQVFTFLDQVKARCGGTLAVSGSHTLLNEGEFLRSKQIARQLRDINFFKQLMTNESIDRSQLINEVEQVNGVDLQVYELAGNPGDVYFMDMRMVHTIGPNAGAIPRAMLTQRFVLDKFDSK